MGSLIPGFTPKVCLTLPSACDTFSHTFAYCVSGSGCTQLQKKFPLVVICFYVRFYFQSNPVVFSLVFTKPVLI